MTRPFLEKPETTVAVGGSVRVANGCDIVAGRIVKVGLANRALPIIQTVEYLRTFLFGRLGWSAINCLLIISGAFGVFRKDIAIAAGLEVIGMAPWTSGHGAEFVLRHPWSAGRRASMVQLIVSYHAHAPLASESTTTLPDVFPTRPSVLDRSPLIYVGTGAPAKSVAAWDY